MLQALAAEQPGRPAGSDYRRRHSLPSQATVQSALRALVRDEVVEQYARGQYGIAEPFLAQWIRAYES